MNTSKTAIVLLMTATLPAQASANVADIYLKCTSRQTLQSTRADGSMPPPRISSNASEYLLWVGSGMLRVISTEVMTSWSSNFAAACPGALNISDGSITYAGKNFNCSSEGPFFGVGGSLNISRLNGNLEAAKRTKMLPNGVTIETTFSGRCEKIEDPFQNKAF